MCNLKSLIETNQIYSSEYGGILANHLPMTIIALNRLGADDKRLLEFSLFYKKRLSLKETKVIEINAENWQTFLGQHKGHIDFLHFFHEEKNKIGSKELLKRYLPILMMAPGSGAFHGLIRTAYGIDAGIESEIVEGLAYWCVSFLHGNREIINSSNQCDSNQLIDIIVNALNDSELQNPPQGSNIIKRQEQIYNRPSLLYHASQINTSTISLKDLACISLKLFSLTQDFTILHTITGTHALRIIMPFLNHPKKALTSMWVDILAATLTSSVVKNFKSLDLNLLYGEEILKTHQEKSWDKISSMAIKSNDDHVSKLVYSCQQEEIHYGWPLYRGVSAIKAGLIKN